jgi:hypothetical protein
MLKTPETAAVAVKIELNRQGTILIHKASAYFCTFAHL